MTKSPLLVMHITMKEMHEPHPADERSQKYEGRATYTAIDSTMKHKLYTTVDTDGSLEKRLSSKSQVVST